MIPAAIPGAQGTGVQPKEWDEATMGRVGNLPFKRVQIDGIWFIETAWTPTPDDIKNINAGGTVILRYSAPNVLVTSLGVNQPVPELTGLSYVSTDMADWVGKVIIWDEDEDAPTRHHCIEVNAAEGWAIVYVNDGDGNPIVDGSGDDAEFRKARIEANLSIRWAYGYGPGAALPNP